MDKGKLIVIEGSDGSGKATQSELLYKRLLNEGKDVRLVSFPNYNSESSALVKMYLEGEFGETPEDINIYAASAFYSVDRFASYEREWKKFYEGGGIVIADRYTTSNMVHQAAKINNRQEKDKYLSWLWDLEFELFKLPIPDVVFFLDVMPEISERLMRKRLNKITMEEEKDIHEKNNGFLVKSYKNALYVAEKYNWVKIDCNNGNNVRDIEEISDDIYSVLMNFI